LEDIIQRSPRSPFLDSFRFVDNPQTCFGSAIAFANRPGKLLDLHWLFQAQLFVQRPDPANPHAI
jgi:hypothetical protein